MTEQTEFQNPEPESGHLSPDDVIKLLDLQTELLAKAVSSEDHVEILEQLCLLAEKLVPESAASVMTYDTDQQQLFVRAAPTLPREAAIALNGLQLGEGSCGNAVQHKEAMYVCNTTEDRRWENIREYAEFFRVGACWSAPIIDAHNNAIGSFALSSFETRQPTNFHRKVLDICASIAGIIFEREEHVKELKHLADSDSLTGLINRRKFTEDAELLLKQVKRAKGKMALILIDLDNFKWINDDYGNEAGDEVLKTVARSLEEHVRDNELVCRWGGDEFLIAIVCKEDCQTDVRAVVKRNLRIFGAPIEAGANEVVAKMSCGVSVYPSDADNLDSLIDCADKAMLHAKSTGRNKLVNYQSIKQDEKKS